MHRLEYLKKDEVQEFFSRKACQFLACYAVMYIFFLLLDTNVMTIQQG